MKPSTALLAFPLALLAAACGSDGTTSSDDPSARTVEVEMRDIAYSPTELSVEVGETIRFVFENTGDVAHDAFVGDEAAQADHEGEMMSPDGGMHHGGSDAITVEPGDTGELTYTFDDAGTILVGCHEQGHYAQGMKITVAVS